MSNTNVYLSGPIAGCDDAECKQWREHTKGLLEDPKYSSNYSSNVLHDSSFFNCLMTNSYTAIDPMVRDYRGQCDKIYHEVVELDKRDIRSCDVMLVNWLFPSVGTSMEILYAWEHNIIIVLVLPDDLPTENASPWLLYHTTKITHSLDRAVKWIGENIK